MFSMMADGSQKRFEGSVPEIDDAANEANSNRRLLGGFTDLLKVVGPSIVGGLIGYGIAPKGEESSYALAGGVIAPIFLVRTGRVLSKLLSMDNPNHQ